nr:MAG TPA: hypothetical protein [Caudoviricetes sp.]
MNLQNKYSPNIYINLHRIYIMIHGQEVQCTVYRIIK